MFIWFDMILAICAIVFLCIGIRLWKKSARAEQRSLTAFTDRRNAVSCFCLAVLCAVIGLCISL